MEKKHAMFLVMAFAMVMILCGSATAVEVPTDEDVTAPFVSVIDPVDKAVGVPVNKTINVTFSEEVKAGSMWIELLASNGASVPITIGGSNDTLTITPNAVLSKATKYLLAIHTGAVTDMAGNPNAGVVFSFTTDSTKPFVSVIDPVDKAVGVPVNKTINVTFSEEVKAGSMWIELLASNVASVPITIGGSYDTLTITPNAVLSKATKYLLAIHTGAVTDMAGNPNAGVVFSFTTDSTKPFVSVIDPVDKAVGVPVNKTINVTFSEEVKAGSMWIELLASNGASVPITIGGSNDTLTITPNAVLSKATKYLLAIHTGAVTDMAGNPNAGVVFSFTTDSTKPFVSVIDPVDKAVGVPVNKTINVTFSEEVKAGSMWIELLASNGASVPITIGGSYDTLTITPNAVLSKATKYILAIHTGAVTDMAGNPNAGVAFSFTTENEEPP